MKAEIVAILLIYLAALAGGVVTLANWIAR